MKNKIKPLFDNVLIRPLEAEAKTASGIIRRKEQDEGDGREDV